MRHNYPPRKERPVENRYDTTYEAYPELPHISRIIDHSRKLITINLYADPFNSGPHEIAAKPARYE